MKSKWLPTFPLHAANWLADPRVQMLRPVQKSELLEALLRSWMLGKSVAVPVAIAEAYAELWPEYEAVRRDHLETYERRVRQTEAARQARHSPVTSSVTEGRTSSVSASVTEGTPTPTPTSTSSRTSSRREHTPSSAAPSGVRDGFAEFWDSYPRKQAKQAALRAWRHLAPDDDLRAAILAAIERHRESDQWRRGFAPMPATFLNGRRWEDEPFGSALPAGAAAHSLTAAETTRAATARGLERLGAL